MSLESNTENIQMIKYSKLIYSISIVSIIRPDESCQLKKQTNLQIKWVEEQDQIFALEVIKTDVFKLSILDGSTLKKWSMLGNSWSPFSSA